MVLTVIPIGISSPDMVLAVAVTAERKALLSMMFGIGSRTEVEVRITIRPCSDLCRCGIAALIRRIVLIRVS